MSQSYKRTSTSWSNSAPLFSPLAHGSKASDFHPAESALSGSVQCICHRHGPQSHNPMFSLERLKGVEHLQPSKHAGTSLERRWATVCILAISSRFRAVSQAQAERSTHCVPSAAEREAIGWPLIRFETSLSELFSVAPW